MPLIVRGARPLGYTRLHGSRRTRVRVLEEFPSLTGNIVALLADSTGRGIDRCELTGDVEESVAKCPDEFTPRFSIQL
jgi:hypothetical protein